MGPNKFCRLVLLCLPLSIIVYGCSAPDLPASAARDMIVNIINSNHYTRNRVLTKSNVPFFGEFHKDGGTFYGVIWDKGSNKENIETLRRCAQQGLLNISRVEAQDGGGRFFYKVKPTDKGLSFINLVIRDRFVPLWGTLDLADIISVEVLSVSEPSKVMGQKRRTVEFTYRYKATPFGEICLSPEELSKVGRKTAIFILSEGVWKVSPEGMSNL
jgi:hypothetical protein